MISYLSQNKKEVVVFFTLFSASVIFLTIYLLGGWKWLEPISYNMQNVSERNNWFVKILLINWEVLVAAVLVLLIGTELVVRFWVGHRYFRIAFFTISAIAISAIIVYLLKVVIGRVRPTTSERYPDINDSFPSGHTMMTTVIFFSLSVLAFKNDHIITSILLCLPPIVMGWSRVRTGEHFIDDVVAGWLFGATCVIGIHILYYYFVPNL